MEVGSALLAIVGTGFPLRSFLKPQTFDVLPDVAALTGNHLSPLDIPLHPADTPNDGIVLFFVNLGRLRGLGAHRGRFGFVGFGRGFGLRSRRRRLIEGV
jgi:hypothetical protein